MSCFSFKLPALHQFQLSINWHLCYMPHQMKTAHLRLAMRGAMCQSLLMISTVALELYISLQWANNIAFLLQANCCLSWAGIFSRLTSATCSDPSSSISALNKLVGLNSKSWWSFYLHLKGLGYPIRDLPPRGLSKFQYYLCYRIFKTGEPFCYFFGHHIFGEHYIMHFCV